MSKLLGALDVTSYKPYFQMRTQQGAGRAQPPSGMRAAPDGVMGRKSGILPPCLGLQGEREWGQVDTESVFPVGAGPAPDPGQRHVRGAVHGQQPRLGLQRHHRRGPCPVRGDRPEQQSRGGDAVPDEGARTGGSTGREDAGTPCPLPTVVVRLGPLGAVLITSLELQGGTATSRLQEGGSAGKRGETSPDCCKLIPPCPRFSV